MITVPGSAVAPSAPRPQVDPTFLAMAQAMQGQQAEKALLGDPLEPKRKPK